MNVQDIVDDLQSLDVNDVGAWPTYVFTVACIFLFALTVGGGYYQFVIPKLELLDRAKGQEAGLRAEFERKQKKVANLDAYRAQLDEMERTFGSMLRQLPSESEVADLLNDISQTRVASGLEEDLFQPKGENRKDFYAELPNAIVVRGDYHDIATFVSRVSALPRIVTINDVKLKKAKNSANTLEMRAVATTYRYLDESGGGQ